MNLLVVLDFVFFFFFFSSRRRHTRYIGDSCALPIWLHDGRGANKPWLQELPDPVSKITWHGWVEVHPETAAKSQLANGDILLLESPHGTVRAPVWITPGVRPNVLAVPSGQGHKAYGRYAKDRSFNAFEL